MVLASFQLVAKKDGKMERWKDEAKGRALRMVLASFQLVAKNDGKMERWSQRVDR